MNLLNLIGATLLAVSPIHEPKNIQIPSDTILQKVEYLDNNIIATSYITSVPLTDSTEYIYTLNISDSKDINVVFNYTVELINDGSSYVYVELVDNINFVSQTEEFEVSTELLHDSYDSSYVDDSYLALTLNEDGVGELYLDCEIDVTEYSSESNNLSFHSFVLTLDVSDDNYSYYNNIFDSTNESYLNLAQIDLGNDNIFSYFLNKYLFTIESSPITNGIFDIVGNTVENYLTTITNLFSRVISLFYVDSKLTILGVLMVFTFGVGIVKFGFNLIKDLLRL